MSYDDRYDDEYYDDEYYDDGYDQYERLPRASRRGSPIAVTVVSVFAVVGILVAGTLVWATRQMNPSGEPGPKVASLEIPSGATFEDVAQILEDNNVIASARVMGWYAKFNDVQPVRAGLYVDFEENSSMSDAIEVLDAGPVPPEETALTIIPGSWLQDAFVAINKAFPEISVDTLSLTLLSGQVTSRYHGPDPTASWEGYLLPETYKFEKDATATEILQKLVDQFDDTLDELGYGNAVAATGHSAQELVIIASLVERETGDPPEERPKMARVMYNRLDEDMSLGVDAALLYGLQRKTGTLTKSELETPGPYNSRMNKGLPPTAISLPSEQSLEAAIKPAEGRILYYVLTNGSPREHTFTETYDEFLAAKKICQREGLC